MKLENNPLDALRAKSRTLRRKGDKTRIQSSSATSCSRTSGSPKTTPIRLLSEEDAERSTMRSPTFDTFRHSHEYPSNDPVLLEDDKELHDPNYVRHNWEMMTGESSSDKLDRSSSLRHTLGAGSSSRRSTLSSRTSSSRPSSRSGSDAGNAHLTTGLGFSAFSGLSSYAVHSRTSRSNTRSTSHSGLQVEGSILRDEEAILDGDDSSDEDESDEEGDYSSFSRRSSLYGQPSKQRLPDLRSGSDSAKGTSSPSTPASPATPELLPTSSTRRRNWTVAEPGTDASERPGHLLPLRDWKLGAAGLPGATLMTERSHSQPA